MRFDCTAFEGTASRLMALLRKTKGVLELLDESGDVGAGRGFVHLVCRDHLSDDSVLVVAFLDPVEHEGAGGVERQQRFAVQIEQDPGAVGHRSHGVGIFFEQCGQGFRRHDHFWSTGIGRKCNGDRFDNGQYARLLRADMTFLARWRAMDAVDRRALFPATWRLGIVRILLASIGVKRTQKLLGRWATAGSRKMQQADLWHRRALALRRVASRTPGARCLARSMVLWWWMRAEGLDPKLCMGVRPGAEMIEGHAWIECDGHTIDETAEVAASYHGLNWRSPK